MKTSVGNQILAELLVSHNLRMRLCMLLFIFCSIGFFASLLIIVFGKQFILLLFLLTYLNRCGISTDHDAMNTEHNTSHIKYAKIRSQQRYRFTFLSPLVLVFLNVFAAIVWNHWSIYAHSVNFNGAFLWRRNKNAHHNKASPQTETHTIQYIHCGLDFCSSTKMHWNIWCSRLKSAKRELRQIHRWNWIRREINYEIRRLSCPKWRIAYQIVFKAQNPNKYFGTFWCTET